MRNYAQIVNKTHVMFNVNDEYYTTLDEVFNDLVSDLIDVLEITRRQYESEASIIAAQGRLQSPDDYEGSSYMSPADSRVIATLWMFYCDILSQENAKPIPGTSLLFYYSNLNTGRSVSAIRIVG